LRKFAVIGYPIEHSFSPDYFKEKFETNGVLDCSYEALEVENIGSIKEVTDYEKLEGFNVTIPHKTEIIKHLDFIDADAAAINAVNTVKVIRGKLCGYNTDYLAFRDHIAGMIDNSIKALVFGSGGSSLAIQFALQKLGVNFEVVSRSNTTGFRYEQLTKDRIEESLLLINCTPVGMFPEVEQSLDLPYQGISSNHICYDLIYNPKQTQFLSKSKERGATVINGLKMLEMQADKSWSIWNS
jgi:shikimate dehydrogenase